LGLILSGCDPAESAAGFIRAENAAMERTTGNHGMDESERMKGNVDCRWLIIL